MFAGFVQEKVISKMHPRDYVALRVTRYVVREPMLRRCLVDTGF